MTFWLLLTVNSVTFGGLLFLLSAGFSLIFGLMRIPNLTHGSMFMVGAYLGTTFLSGALGFTLNFWVAALLAAVEVAILGALMERLLLRRLAGREDTGYPAVAIEAELAAILGDPVAARHATGRAAQLDGPHARVLVDAYAAAAEQDWAAVERHLAHLVAAAPFNCCVAAWRGLASAGRGDDRAAAEFRDFADRCSDCNCVAKARLADLVAAR